MSLNVSVPLKSEWDALGGLDWEAPARSRYNANVFEPMVANARQVEVLMRELDEKSRAYLEACKK